MKSYPNFFMAGLLALIVGCGASTTQTPEAFSPGTLPELESEAVVLNLHSLPTDVRLQAVSPSALPVAQDGYVAAVGINAVNQSDGTVLIELATATDGALIRFTTDGSEPTWSSPWYSAPLRLPRSTTLKAFALRQGLGNSPVRTFTFEAVLPSPVAPTPTPTPTPNPTPVQPTPPQESLEPLPPLPGRVGAVGASLVRGSSGVQVSLRTLTEGALIRYTTDGSEPDWRSPWYSTPLTLGPSARLRTIAMRSGLGNSPVRDIPLGGALPNPTPTPTPVPTPVSPTNRTISYAASNEIFPNPERGFRRGVQLIGFGDFAGERARGNTLLQAYVRLQDFKAGPIPQGYLEQIRGQLEAVRVNGLKVTLRFWYTWSPDEADAPKAVVLEHIRQLTPILREYSDVILALQSGFIGAWGEWHSSRMGLDNPSDKREIFNLLAQALPSRRIQLRTVADLRLVAPSGSEAAVARLGHHNDCFMVNQSDAGTYAWDGAARDDDRAYLQRLTLQGVPVTGEMCGDVPESGSDPYNRRTPEGQLAELERFRWTSIANDFGPVERWRQWGIYDTISRRLGYRYRLTSATLPGQVSPGGRLVGQLNLSNDGFAAIANPRPVRLVLRERSSRATLSLDIADARNWRPGASQVGLNLALPSTLARGTYDLLLHLPDESVRLAGRPEYAVRLANPDLWEASSGYNSLNATLQVQ